MGTVNNCTTGNYKQNDTRLRLCSIPQWTGYRKYGLCVYVCFVTTLATGRVTEASDVATKVLQLHRGLDTRFPALSRRTERCSLLYRITPTGAPRVSRHNKGTVLPSSRSRSLYLVVTEHSLIFSHILLNALLSFPTISTPLTSWLVPQPTVLGKHFITRLIIRVLSSSI